MCCRNGQNEASFPLRGCYCVWRFSLEMLVKYLGILERLEPRGHPSFHSDLDDQAPPEQNSLMLFTHLSQQFQKKHLEKVAGGQTSTLWVWELVL